MAVNLRNRSFCKELDFTPDELRLLIGLGADLKRAKSAGTERPRLPGKRIALVFEKASTRTRVAFEVAAYDQGAHVTYLGPTGTHIGHEESIRTPLGCWAASTTGSPTAASGRTSSRHWPPTPGCPCGTG
jgi:ornithine carbamoyltransferase